MKPTLTAIALGIGAALSACSAGPSESDMKIAVQQSMNQSNAAMDKLLGEDAKTEVLSFKKIGCKENGNAYMCDFEMRVKAPMVGEHSMTTAARFVEGSKGWTVSQ